MTSREWKQKVKTSAGFSTVTYTETACPDADCQKIVEAKQAELRDKDFERARLKTERQEFDKKAKSH